MLCGWSDRKPTHPWMICYEVVWGDGPYTRWFNSLRALTPFLIYLLLAISGLYRLTIYRLYYKGSPILINSNVQQNAGHLSKPITSSSLYCAKPAQSVGIYIGLREQLLLGTRLGEPSTIPGGYTVGSLEVPRAREGVKSS